jgi:branched-chain amino acid transport system permease protein
MEKSSLSARIAIAAVALSFAAFPFVGGPFYIQLVTKIMIMAIFAMSLDLLVGYTGLVSLGHAAFFGVAGYAVALASPQYEAGSLWLTLTIALGCSALLAAAIGALVLRTSGVYFIMATLAFAQMIFYFFHDAKFAGGSDGLYVMVKPEAMLFGHRLLDLDNKLHFYYFVGALMIAVYVLLRIILQSSFGHALRGIKGNEMRMRSLGFSVYYYKLAVFTLAGTLAGLAGYLAALQFGFVNPELLGWHHSGNVLMMVILGGMGSLVGPVIGAFSMVLLQEFLSSLTKHWPLVMGLFIVVVALALPHGIGGLVERLTLKTRGKAGEASHG